MRSELLSKLDIRPGEVGENVTTLGVDLLGLGEGDLLVFVPVDGEEGEVEGEGEGKRSDGVESDGEEGEFGKEGLEKRIEADEKREGAVVRITGLRNPCPQIDKFRKGLREKFLVRDAERNVVGRKVGVMAVVLKGGWVRPGMRIVVQRAEGERRELGCV